jgi:integrase
MPKLTNKPPKYTKSEKYACVYRNGKKIYLGLYGSPESKAAYARFVAESKAGSELLLSKGEPGEVSGVTVKELALAFLDDAKKTLAKGNYGHHRIVVQELLKLYGDNIPVDSFTPKCLRLFRQGLIDTHRFCRKTVNNYVCRVVGIFTWGVSEECVQPNTEALLKAVKPLQEGYVGTYDLPEREDVSDDVIKATLPFMPPTVAAMVKLQRLTGMRPSEVFNMRVGQIDRRTDPEIWLYRLPCHKTKKKTKRDKIVPLGKPEQKLILPYLEGKEPGAAVFSLHTAMAERRTARRANRKTRVTSAQRAKDDARAENKYSRYSEFYGKDSYRSAVEYAIAKGNKNLPDGEKIPHWTPYQLRHAASSAMEVEVGFEASQVLLDHASPNTTARYNHRRLQKQKRLARKRRDIFAEK